MIDAKTIKFPTFDVYKQEYLYKHAFKVIIGTYLVLTLNVDGMIHNSTNYEIYADVQFHSQVLYKHKVSCSEADIEKYYNHTIEWLKKKYTRILLGLNTVINYNSEDF